MKLDLDYVRSQFPAFSEPSLAGTHFFENAGGSYACGQTIAALEQFYRTSKVQPYHPHKAAERAGSAMDKAFADWAAALGVEADQVQFGPSTSANSYVLAQAFSPLLQAGDEIIVTLADHEANSGAIRRMADARGLRLLEWQLDPISGQLEQSGLEALLSHKTALVCLPHCSNILGQQYPIAHWTGLIKQAAKSPWIVVDGVSNAPHQIPNVAELGCDLYLFSLYKLYSVHQGVMVVEKELLYRLAGQGHFFNDAKAHYRLTPAGPDHGQIAASSAVLDYCRALDMHHQGKPHDQSISAMARRVNQLWHDHEQRILPPLLDYLGGRDDLRIIGSTHISETRHPTVSFVPRQHDPHDFCTRLGTQNIMAGSGHFYAWRLLDSLGLDPERGVVRLSMVHYNSHDDVAAAIQAMDQIR